MSFIKNLIPEELLKLMRPFYHGLLALASGFYFNRPSEKMVVIGVTGTTGKSTTVAMLAHILNSAGKKCGYVTTVNFFDGESDFLNKHGVSMPGGPLLQKHLSQMLAKGCKYAVIECTSEGLAQNRHLGINFDVAVFTNLSGAHLEAHGSFGNYQEAKGRLFALLSDGTRKNFFPKKMIGANFDDPISGYFLSFPADYKFGVSFNNIQVSDANKVFQARLNLGSSSVFQIDGSEFELSMLGAFNVKNAVLASAVANVLGVGLEDCSSALKNFYGVRGRMESVPNDLGFTVVVDFGCEPASIKAALEASAQLPHSNLIHVFGSAGGHRDKNNRFVFGKTSAQFADRIVITNDDVYDSDEKEIANDIESGIKSFKLRQPEVEIVLDRRSAIGRALSVAQKEDIILITGKGSEQFLSLPGNKRIEWDDVSVVKEEIAKLGSIA